MNLTGIIDLQKKIKVFPVFLTYPENYDIKKHITDNTIKN